MAVNAKEFASGQHEGVKIVAEYLDKPRRLIEGVLERHDTGYRDACIKGLYLRCILWFQTLIKLGPRDYQAIVGGNRALVEILVDLILLHYDKTNASGWKMYQWGMSERMKAAEVVVGFYQKRGEAVPETHQPMLELYQNEKAMVDYMRRALWPDKKNPTKAVHPARWTGRGSLFPDVELADALHGRAIQEDLGLTLVEYYKTEYRKINWQVHSGVAGFWGLNPDTFWIIGGLALKACADLGMLCAKIVLADFEFTRVIDELDEEWQNVRLKRGLAHITALGLDPNEVL